MKQDKFFAQSYSDALEDYMYSCIGGKGENWDWIILTAANKRQAAAYELQIEKRKAEKRLPAGTRIAIIPDYEDKRIGSGGATLNVLRYIAEETGYEGLFGQKILVIHSGGDSKRIPQYSACGKLFAPVPRMLPDGMVSAVFDELLIAASGIPARVGKGMMVFPSDTLLLFNPLQLDLLSCSAAALSMKAPVTDGQEHGVFLQGEGLPGRQYRKVARFLHKLPEAALREAGAVDGTGQVDIDTGCIWLGTDVMKALSGLIFDNGVCSQEKFRKFVNPRVCLNFYADFVYPLSDKGSLIEYLQETPENGISQELAACREAIWGNLRHYSLSLVKLIPARYIHFGMTHEMFRLFVKDIDKYSYLGWEKRLITNAAQGTVINSYVSKGAACTDRVFIENSYIGSGARIGDGAVISNVDLEAGEVPEGAVLSSIQLDDGRFVCRIYGKEDNPKASGNARNHKGILNIEKLIQAAGISKQEVWGGHPASIWNAAIYPAKRSSKEAAVSALEICQIIEGNASQSVIEGWKAADKFSLASSFIHADMPALLKRQAQLRMYVKLQVFYKDLLDGVPARECIGHLCRDYMETEIKSMVHQINSEAAKQDFPDNMRMYLAVSDICRKYLPDHSVQPCFYENKAYEAIKHCIARETFQRSGFHWQLARICKDEITVELPVRINFCGSPSDAAPYCLEHGGAMLDGALLLNGQKPIKATVKRIPSGITFGSEDQGNRVHYTDLNSIRDCRNPFEPFALHKAALLATGLVPIKGDMSMEEFCKLLGGGLSIYTKADVPKGSGLGTSSLIAAAIVKAIHLMFKGSISDQEVYAQVFLAEQLMDTGGGWQDQVGGLTPGVKYFTSAPGIYQEIQVDTLVLSSKAKQELNERFALIFSGQRRLARNVLREEMNQCIRNDPESLKAVKQIQEYCAVMRYYLLKGDITEFAGYVSKQFALVKVLDKGATNTCIEYIFDVCGDLIDGKSVCGAGGGGFLQVILKKGITKRQLKERIAETFIDCGVEVWDCEII